MSPQIERAKSLPTTARFFRRTKTIGVKNEKPEAAQNGYKRVAKKAAPHVVVKSTKKLRG
jgi:hypothetical protein